MTAPDLHSPRVTAIIPAYNAAAFVRNAIDSALAQAWPNIEVLVIDDGSTDDTASILQAYGEAIRVVSPPNGGLSNARNRGIHEATGTYVAFLDADDRWLPGKIARQVQALTDNPQAGFCSTVTQVEAPDGTPTGEWGCPQIDTSLLHTLFLFLKIKFQYGLSPFEP